MGSRKMVLMNLFAGQQWRNRHEEQTSGQGEGEEGEDKMYGESNMEIYNTLCKIDSQWEFTIRLRELKQSSVTRRVEWREKWKGGSGGRGHGCTYGLILHV